MLAGFGQEAEIRVRVGVLPKIEEDLVFRGIASGAGQAEMRQRIEDRCWVFTAMVEYLAVLRDRCRDVLLQPIRLAAEVLRPEGSVVGMLEAQGGSQLVDCLRSVATMKFQCAANHGQPQLVEQRVLGISFRQLIGELLHLRGFAA